MLVPRPEDQILICVARQSLDAAATERLRELLKRELDWKYLVATAHHHCLAPLLNLHLKAAPPSLVPPHVMDRLQRDDDQNTKSNLSLAGELLKLLDLFEGQGIEAIPFKGPTLAVCAYGDVGLRQFGDLDLLVRKRDVPRVIELLVSRNFKPTPELTDSQRAALLRFDCAQNFKNGNNVVLDLHWNFTAPSYAFAFDVDSLWSRLETVNISSRPIVTLTSDDLLLILCLHGATHFWERLGWISDVAGLITRGTNLDWQRALSSAAALGAQRILLLGLFLAGELLQAPIPEGVWKVVMADPTVRTIAGQVQKQLFAEEDAAPGIFDSTRLHLSMRERRRDRLRYCLHLAATPRVYDWMVLPLPDRLFFLYYLLRPLRLTGKYGVELLKGPRGPEQSTRTTK
ncbi:MAG TPA: nucleotidyltransferase family protein [Pyrinomonadaceae bacterium]|nr:nucleotidyltransferase family protein [Pyrinomonadaceae bacterium]